MSGEHEDMQERHKNVCLKGQLNDRPHINVDHKKDQIMCKKSFFWIF